MSANAITRSRARTVFASVLLLLGIGLAAVWMFYLGPQIKSLQYDEAVLFGQNSPAWWEVHYRASRQSWKHDDFENIGLFATKEDVPWIIESGRSGEEFGGCQGGHRSGALEIISNQNAGPTKEDWQQWWKENQEKTQNRWILDGFIKHGLQVSFPLNRRMELDLLRLIGRHTRPLGKHTEQDEAMKHVRFNALRLLRDVEFDPAGITVQELTDDKSGELMKGLVALAGWQTKYPVRNGVGVVFVGEDHIRPHRLSPIVYWLPGIWWILAGLSIVGGVRLWQR